MSSPLRVLVVDDEPLARQRLIDLLSKVPEADLVGTAENGLEAIDAIQESTPDLVFLDVQMPGLTGIDVVREVGPAAMPATVFVTAYDQHALAAFELAALDYLLKPFEDARFRVAFERARDAIRQREVNALQGRLLALLQAQPDGAPPAAAAPARTYLERIAVDMRGQIRVIPVEDVDFITSAGSYAEVHVGDTVHVIREQMQGLEERLDPNDFVRIHRSTIVQIDRVDALLKAEGGDYAVRLKDGRRLKVARGRRDELASRLDIDPTS